MEYTNIRFTKSIQPVAYENETLEVHATMDSTDNLQECVTTLKAEVAKGFGRVPVGQAAPKKAAPAKKKVETDTPTTEEPAPKKAPAPKKKAAPKKKKDIAYDREVQSHKTAFGKLALEIEPTWQKDDDLKTKVKGLSVSMAGTPMFNAEGDVLEAFKNELKEGLSSGEDDL